MTISPRDFTVGVEEEYQLVDAHSGDLRSRARWVIAGDWTGQVKPEMQQHTIEVETRVCEGTHCVRDDLARLRFQAATVAGRELAETQSIFGMHVHVGVPEHLDRTRVANVARFYLPMLLALSGSSPYWQGRDTGYCSFRTLLWRRWPRTGAPPRFEGAGEYELLLKWLTETGCVDGPGRIYWDLRPHHRYPTVEFRASDVTPRLEDAVAGAALARAVVAGIAAGVLREPGLPSSVAQPLLGENSWRAARDGTGAELVDLFADRPRTVPVREAVLGLAEKLRPLAIELGDGDSLAALEGVFDRGCAAVRMRRAMDELGGDLRRLSLWAADETVLGLGMDRRNEQRLEETTV